MDHEAAKTLFLEQAAAYDDDLKSAAVTALRRVLQIGHLRFRLPFTKSGYPVSSRGICDKMSGYGRILTKYYGIGKDQCDTGSGG